ncbi:hypothetical protein K8R66_00120 [bacterium]|nr:hypothetical protein [bacterium]
MNFPKSIKQKYFIQLIKSILFFVILSISYFYILQNINSKESLEKILPLIIIIFTVLSSLTIIIVIVNIILKYLLPINHDLFEPIAYINYSQKNNLSIFEIMHLCRKTYVNYIIYDFKFDINLLLRELKSITNTQEHYKLQYTKRLIKTFNKYIYLLQPETTTTDIQKILKTIKQEIKTLFLIKKQKSLLYFQVMEFIIYPIILLLILSIFHINLLYFPIFYALIIFVILPIYFLKKQLILSRYTFLFFHKIINKKYKSVEQNLNINDKKIIPHTKIALIITLIILFIGTTLVMSYNKSLMNIIFALFLLSSMYLAKQLYIKSLYYKIALLSKNNSINGQEGDIIQKHQNSLGINKSPEQKLSSNLKFISVLFFIAILPGINIMLVFLILMVLIIQSLQIDSKNAISRINGLKIIYIFAIISFLPIAGIPFAIIGALSCIKKSKKLKYPPLTI